MKYFFKNILLSLLIFKLAFSSLAMATKEGMQLRRAARKGDVATLTQLLKSNVNVNEVNATNGRTALMYATINGHADTVELLLDWGANAEQRDEKGFTALCHHIHNSKSGLTGPTRETENGDILVKFISYSSIFDEEKYQKICGSLLFHYKGNFEHEKELMKIRNGEDDLMQAIPFWQYCTEKYASTKKNEQSLNIMIEEIEE